MRTLLFAAILITPVIAAADETHVDVTRDHQGGRKYTFRDPIDIHARLHLPRAIYVLQRTNLAYDTVSLDESLAQRIRDEVKHDPF